MAEMRLLTQIWRMEQTRWIRVVHSGYGNAVWHEDLRASNLTFVAASAHPEGCYVPATEGRDQHHGAKRQQRYRFAV